MNMPVFQGFDASNYSAPSFGVLPKGWYRAQIAASEMKPTQKGGMFIQLTFDILDGFAKGRKIFARYNVINENEETVRIAYEQLGALSHAVGVVRWQQPAELHGRPLNLRLKVVDGKGEYEDSNEPNGYANINDPVKYAVKVEATGATPANAMMPGAVSTVFPGAAQQQQTGAVFPGAAQTAPVQQQQATFPGAVQQPVQQQQAQQTQVQQPAQQQVQQAQQQAAQPWANAQQPWDNPANNAAPQQQVQQVVEQPVVQQQMQQAAPVQEQQQPVQQQVTQPWAQQTAQPGQAAAPAQGQQQPQQQVEAHPAQAAVPPWQQQQ